MKQLLQKMLVLMAVMLIGSAVSKAEKFSVDGIYYNITSETDLTVEVTSSNSDKYSGSVVIPETVTYDGKTYSVKSIGYKAFDACSSLASVTIPNSVTSIGGYAFSGCSTLASVTIGNSVTSIGAYAFRACMSLASVTIPNSVTSIGDYAFTNCSSLTSFTVGDLVRNIGTGVFSNCSSLTSIIVNEGNPVFDSREDCNAIIKTDTNTLLAGCKNTIIPNSVTSIGELAFCGSYYLTFVTIPNSVKSIGVFAFEGTGWWYNQPDGLVYLDNWLLDYKGTKPSGHVDVKEGTKGIADSAFRDCSSLTSVTIGNSVTSIGEMAFHNCSSLTSVIMGNSVISIGDNAFSLCSSLTSVTIGNSVTSIGNMAFNSCSSLTSVTIGNSVTSIGSWAFSECPSLTSITVEATTPPTTVDERSFSGCYSAKLRVPQGTLETYRNADEWKNFTDIEEFVSSSISLPTLGENNMEEAPIYDLRGVRIPRTDNLPSGIYIRDGKKMILK